ncbi:unnamed protein product, partial [Discosporangium mesarthrocarpum]
PAVVRSSPSPLGVLEVLNLSDLICAGETGVDGSALKEALMTMEREQARIEAAAAEEAAAAAAAAAANEE